MDKAKVILITSRPVLWLGPAAIYLIGARAALVNFDFLFWIGFFFITFPMGLLVYGLNDISDYESDSINPRKGSWEGGVLEKEYSSLIYCALFHFILPIILTLLFFKHYLSLILIGCIILFSYFYSCKPIRLKSVPFLDSISNGLWVVFIFIFGLSFSKEVFHLPIIIFPIFLGVLAMHALTTIMDYEEDKLSNDKTISIFLGKRVTALISALIFFSLIFLVKPLNFYVLFYLILSLGLILASMVLDKKNIYHFSCWAIGIMFPLLILYLLFFRNDYVNLVLSLKI